MIPKESLLEGTPVLKSGVDYTKVKLSPKEAFLLSRMDGNMKLKDIIHLSSMGLEETLAAVLSLTLKEIVAFREYTLAQIKGETSAATVRPVDPRSKPSAPPQKPVQPQKPAPQQTTTSSAAPQQVKPVAQQAKPAAPLQNAPAQAQPKPAPQPAAPPKPAAPPAAPPPQAAPPPKATPQPQAAAAPVAPVVEEVKKAQAVAGEPIGEVPEYQPPPRPAARPPGPPRPGAAGPRLAQAIVPRDDVVEDLSEMKLSGNFAEYPYPKLLADLNREKHTGILHIYRQKNGPYKEIYYRSGVPVFICGSYVIERECLGHLLQASGKISDYDLKKSLDTMVETREMQGQILLRMGVINGPMLNATLKWQVEIKLAEIFTWKLGEGYFEFYVVGTFHRPIEPIQINIAGMILKGIKRGFAFSAVQAQLNPKMDKYLNKKTPPLFNPEDFKFQLPEERLWENAMDGSKTVREIIEESHMDPQHANQFIFALDCCEMVEFRDRPLGATNEDKIISDLKERLKLSEKGQHFDALGIHWTSVGHKVQQGWEKIQREYGPESKLQQVDLPEIVELAKKIYEMGKIAYEFLIDDKRRPEYRNGLFNETKLSLSAELLYQQAESQLLWKEDYAGALENLEPAAELKPRDFIIQAAFATALIKRYYPANPDRYREAEKILQRALTGGSNSDMVHFYAGHAYWGLKRTTHAKTEFENAIRINPNNHDARKALRMLNKASG